MERLTREICNEYREKLKNSGEDKNPNQTGMRRQLTMELMERCAIPEIWACNILNGYHIRDYLGIQEKRFKDAKENKDKKKKIPAKFDEIAL